jgi:RNA polymerase sigma-70 factor (ECF subfamily)
MGRKSFDIEDKLLLMRAVCQKDRRARATLYLKYAPQVRSYIASHVSSGADTEDLVQEVFLQVCRGKGHYDSSKAVRPYIFGIARNVIRRYDREKKRSPETMPADSLNGLFPRYNSRESIDPVRRISAKQWKRILARGDVGLSVGLREAIELRFIEGLSCEEAARRLGCSKWAFYKKIERAKKLLKDALKGGSQPPYEF